MAAVKHLTSPAVLVTIALVAASILPLVAGLAQRELTAAVTVSCADTRSGAAIYRAAA